MKQWVLKLTPPEKLMAVEERPGIELTFTTTSCIVPHPEDARQQILVSDVNETAEQVDTPTNAEYREVENAKFLPNSVNEL